MKIIIVDDEFLFRTAIKVSLDFESLGLEIVGEARNGREAIALVDNYAPDIALVDINMPVIDGLEFARYIRENNINTRIIFISGYDQFDYAKEAMHLGAHSYLLKPVDEEELKRELTELINEIEIDQFKVQELSMLKSQVKENIPFLRERLVLDILMGHHDEADENLKKKMDYLNIDMPYESFCVIVTDIIFNTEMDEELREAHRMTISNLYEKLFMNAYNYQWTYDYKGRLTIILNVNEHCTEERLISKFRSIISAAYNSNSLTVHIGISNYYNDIRYTNTGYKEALAALSYCNNENKSFGFYSIISENGLEPIIINKEQRNELLISMRMGDSKNVELILNKIFSKIANHHLKIMYIKYIYMELSLICMEVISEFGESEEYFSKWISQLYDEKNYNQKTEDISSWIKSVYFEIMKQIEQNRSSKSVALVNEIKKSIELNYNKCDFSIEKIANTLYVNYSHLCYVFKRETKTTINEYLVQMRINKAIEFMDNGYKVVRNISEMVGFADSGYFSKSFKKCMGITPTQYINSKS